MPPVIPVSYSEAPMGCSPIVESSLYGLFVLCLVAAAKRAICGLHFLPGSLRIGLPEKPFGAYNVVNLPVDWHNGFSS